MNKFIAVVRHGRFLEAGDDFPLSSHGQLQMQQVRQIVFAHVERTCAKQLGKGNFVVFSFSNLARATASAQILAGDDIEVQTVWIPVMERASLLWGGGAHALAQAITLVEQRIAEKEILVVGVVAHADMPAIFAEALRDKVLQTKGRRLDSPRMGEGYLVSLENGEIIPIHQPKS